jgi:hypothetical protein
MENSPQNTRRAISTRRVRPPVPITAPYFLLPGFAKFVYIFVSADGIAFVLELLDISLLRNCIHAVTNRSGVADSVIEDLNLMFADQIQHGFPVFARNCNSIPWH